MKHIQLFTILTILALSLQGCSDTTGYKDEPKPLPTPSGSGIAYIQLDISLLDLAANTRTRVDEVSYVDATIPQELINMLRIIIVDGSGYVEHNRLVDLTTPTASYTSAIFKVKGNDKKHIYIFANELPYEWEGKGYFPFGTLIPGLNFNGLQPGGTQSFKDAIENLIVKADPYTHILFDNRGESKTNIPINEHFEFEVGMLDNNKTDSEGNALGTIRNPYVYNCFITRAATKFTFNATYEGAENFKEAINIKEIRISKIGNQEYLLPKATTYSPAKGEESSNPYKGRYITAYDVPNTGTVNEEYTFPVDFQFSTDITEYSYAPEIYFPETELATSETAYKIQIVTGNENNTFESTWETLPNLPRLSRNTHVIVNFKLSPRNISCVVEVVPYVEIKLDPVFGDFNGDSPIISWPVHNFKSNN